MIRIVYRIYQVFILLPVVVIVTAIIGTLVSILNPLGNDHWRSWFTGIMGRCWGWTIVRATLLPVSVTGMEKMKKNQSYVIVANHESCYDIFLIIGFLKMKLRWMMKASLMKVPFVGAASRASGFIPVDTSTPAKVHETYLHACKTITDGVSLVVFPEGKRSFDGQVGPFKKGAFMIADKLQLPLLPITLHGTFEVMPRQRDFHFANWHPLKIEIHDPIYPIGQGAENIHYLKEASRESIVGKESKTN